MSTMMRSLIILLCFFSAIMDIHGAIESCSNEKPQFIDVGGKSKMIYNGSSEPVVAVYAGQSARFWLAVNTSALSDKPFVNTYEDNCRVNAMKCSADELICKIVWEIDDVKLSQNGTEISFCLPIDDICFNSSLLLVKGQYYY